MPDSNPTRSRPHVVVVGGGIAGLVAARDLIAGGARVTLLEASARLGGKVRSHSVGGVELDAGAESFATRGGTVAALAAELGLAGDLVTPGGEGAWLQPRDGDAVPLPKAGLLGIPSVPLARDVIAVVGVRGAIRAQLDPLLPGVFSAKERYLGPLVRRRMGRAVLDLLVTPIATAIHAKHPDELELDIVAPRIRQALIDRSSLAQAVQVSRAAAPAGSAVQGIDGGVFRLTEALAAAVRDGGEVRLEAEVSAVTESGVTLHDGSTLAADHVVLAAPIDEQAGTPIVLATLVVRDERLDAAPRGTGVIVAPGTGQVTAKALTHASVKWDWVRRAAGNAHVLRLSYEADAASAGGLQELALRDVRLLLGMPIDAASVRGFARQEWSGRPGHTRAPVAGVTEVGERVAGVGLAAVIAHTRRAIAAILGDLDTAPDYA